MLEYMTHDDLVVSLEYKVTTRCCMSLFTAAADTALGSTWNTLSRRSGMQGYTHCPCTTGASRTVTHCLNAVNMAANTNTSRDTCVYYDFEPKKFRTMHVLCTFERYLF